MISLLGIWELDTIQLFLILLLAFILGLFVAWFLWGKYKRRYHFVANELDDLEDEFDQLKDSHEQLKNKIESNKKHSENIKEKRVDREESIPANFAFGINISKFNALDSDNLQIFEGIGPKMSDFLHGKGINSWETLATYDENYLKELLGKEGNKYRIINPTSWPAQANLASKGEWKKLITLQKNLVAGRKNVGKETDSKIEKIMIRLGILVKWKANDLKAVEGIGPKIGALLNANGIKTWEKLANTPVDELNTIIESAGKKFQLADPGSWPKQAKLAAEGKWQELEILQAQLNAGKA